MKPDKHCIKEEQQCGTPGLPDGQCCHGLQCETLTGDGKRFCVPAAATYLEYRDKNAFQPYGAVDIDDHSSAAKGLTVAQCQDRCTATRHCSCVSFERSTGTCWRRRKCDPDGWTSRYNIGYNVYLRVHWNQHTVAESTAAIGSSDKQDGEALFYP
eukprot:TRINITY_DN7459_c1_g1_i1.p2 TRINITY_DN7459_c1_g1~~TRINITY_DN7459_c1_g1_i1.p2  ORF type:complete len:156 (+),score=24.83 TRINITY_DN7459_c1_g1_i1:950-1417(+)